MTRIRFRRGASSVVRALAWFASTFARMSIVGVVLVAGSDAAFAQTKTRTAFLIDRLQYPPVSGVQDDFRVRTNAALTLGGTDDDDAVTPLCQALADPSEVVRQAVAVALKRLARPSSGSCMKSRLNTETNAAVKLQLQRAIESLAGAGTGSAGASASGTGDPDAFVPPLVSKAKYYISISKVTNNTKRGQGDVDKVVLAAIRSKLSTLGDYQIAPLTETPDAARAVMSKRKLKGYYLSVAVENQYTSDGLRVKVKCAVFTYPGKALLGEMPTSLLNPSIRSADPSAEDNLMDMAAAHSVELFAQNITQL